MNDPDDVPKPDVPPSEAVDAYRKKLDSITEITLPLTRALNKRIERARRAMGQETSASLKPRSAGALVGTGEEDTDPDLEIEYALELEEEDDEAPSTS